MTKDEENKRNNQTREKMMKQHKWHKEIKDWADGKTIEFKELGKEDWYDDDDPEWCDPSFEFRIKPPAKCITKDCTNHVNEGKFVGELCAPCWDYITNGKGVHSQAYRNAQPKEPQYLYVYGDEGGVNFSQYKTAMNCGLLYIGKIKLEVDDAE